MFRCVLSCLVVGLLAASPFAGEPRGRLEFTRMVAHWANYGGADYLAFVEEAKPELVQHGFYGGHFWSLAHTPQFSGYPAHFPVRGLDECGRWFDERNRALHARGVKVIGHFNVEFLVGDPDGDDGPRGFFRFYRDLWDEGILGPKPVADPIDLLEKNADGTPISQKGYAIGGMREYWACLRNPNWQKVLKAWVKHGIDRGLDGFIANYFYRHNCLCEHCQRGFRRYLSDRFSDAELRNRFDIEDPSGHRFDEIVCWHDPAESTPLRREMLRWSQISSKEVFDEVFVRFGRSLEPDLIVAQWNHLGAFGQISGDERCLLPAELWGRDEDYLWYSTGAAAYYTDLSKRFLGEGTLQARYIRGAFDDKPFTLGKYESTRIRVAISELAANGGAPMGFYTRFTDPEARREIARYYRFLERFDEVHRGARSHAEAVLLFPRRAVHAGNVAPVRSFRELGTKLLDEHVLFDVLPDDLATEERLARYRRTFTSADVDGALGAGDRSLSRFVAPYTVRVSANRSASGNELTLHFVNYNREEPPPRKDGQPNAGGGIVDEKPIPVAGVQADFVLPPGISAGRLDRLTPEADAPKPLAFTRDGNRIKFELPEFLVYCIVRVHAQ